MNPEHKPQNQPQEKTDEPSQNALKTQKLRLEIESLENALRPKITKQHWMRALVWVVVALPLTWFFMKEIFLPLYKHETRRLLNETNEMQGKLSVLGNKIKLAETLLDSTTLQLDQKEALLSGYQRELNVTNDSLHKTQRTLTVLYDSLDSATARLLQQEKDHLARMEELKNQFSELSQKLAYTRTQRDDFKRNASELEGKIKSQRGVITELNKQIRKTASGILQLRSQGVASLSAQEVKNMLSRYRFYCADNSLTREWSSSNGRGLNNSFVRRNGRLIVYDQTTGLMWQTEGSGRVNHENAKNYVARLNQIRFAGYADWRVPTLEEIMSLMTPQPIVGGLHINPLFDNSKAYLWSADSRENGEIWFADFAAGVCYSKPSTDINYLRAVRTVPANQ